MMRNLLFVSILSCILLSACANVRSGCRKQGEMVVNREELPGIIDSSVGINKFNLQIDIASKHFSGLLLVKQIGNTNFRTVFTTHFGMRVFDFEFIGDSLEVHYCIEPMQKEKIIRLFKNDFSRLWGWQGEENKKVRIYGDKKTEGNEIRVYRMGRHLFYRKTLKEGTIQKISSGRRWRKTTWTFENFQHSYPDWIEIHHALWPITLKLERL